MLERGDEGRDDRFCFVGDVGFVFVLVGRGKMCGVAGAEYVEFGSVPTERGRRSLSASRAVSFVLYFVIRPSFARATLGGSS